ncbi:MAG TPA: hypothetical protein VII13_22225 [Vicinamibacteria bacterium]
MKRIGLAVFSLAVLLGTSATADDHLVTLEAAQARLAAAEAERQGDLARVEAALGSPLAREAAAMVGADVATLRAALPGLTDHELRDLAARAALLETDPVAGLDQDIRLLLIIFLIVAIVILVLQAVD